MPVLIRVQHRVGREEPLQRLLFTLGPSVTSWTHPRPVEVICDDEDPPNPMRGYMKCLADLPENGHVAVIQDDVIVARNFELALERIADANPDVPVSLFISKIPRRTYSAALLRHGKSRYVDMHRQDLVHVVGTLWPVQKAFEFRTWIEENPLRIRGGELSTSDDANVTRWMQLTGQRIRVAIPNIVQHPDDVPSIVNGHKVKHGLDSGRTSALWIGEQDPLELDWSR